MAGDAANTVSTLDGLFKIVYADKIKDVIPNFAKLQADIPFKAANRLGEEFWCPVVLQLEQGVVYAASGDGAFSLTSVDATPAVIAKAKIKGSQMVMRAQMDYEAAHSAESGGVQAFENSTGVVVRNMWQSIRKRVELDMIYGGDAGLTSPCLGVLTVAEFTTKAYTFKAATWSAGIWAGMEGATIGVLASGSNTTLRDTQKISAVSIADKKLTTAVGLTGAAKGDKVVFASQHGGTTADFKTAVGLITMLGTGSLDIHGITKASYSIWQPNTTAIGTWGLAALLGAITPAVAKGLDEDVNAYLAPTAFDTLAATEATYRSYDSSYSPVRFETGAEQLVFHGQTGKITIKPHPFMWDTYGVVIPPKTFSRIGATDVTFDRAAMAGVNRPTSYFLELPTKAGYELRCYSHQGLFCEAPGKSVLLTAI